MFFEKLNLRNEHSSYNRMDGARRIVLLWIKNTIKNFRSTVFILHRLKNYRTVRSSTHGIHLDDVLKNRIVGISENNTFIRTDFTKELSHVGIRNKFKLFFNWKSGVQKFLVLVSEFIKFNVIKIVLVFVSLGFLKDNMKRKTFSTKFLFNKLGKFTSSGFNLIKSFIKNFFDLINKIIILISSAKFSDSG